MDYLDQIEYTIIETDEGTVELAEKFIDLGFLKRRSYDDCRHIAAAILAGCYFIISWNFKHIVNVKTIRGSRPSGNHEEEEAHESIKNFRYIMSRSMIQKISAKGNTIS